MKKKILLTVLLTLLIPAASWGQSLDGLFGVKFGTSQALMKPLLNAFDFTLLNSDYKEGDYRFDNYYGIYDLFDLQIISISVIYQDDKFVAYILNFTDDFNPEPEEKFHKYINNFIDLFGLCEYSTDIYIDMFENATARFVIYTDDSMGKILSIQVVQHS